MIKILISLAVSTSLAARADVVRVTDDREIALPSVVFVDGTRVGPTNEVGVIELNASACTGGAEVTAVPVDNEQAYILPSSRGRCLGRPAPVSVVVTRRLIVGNLETWIDLAASNEDWGLAAHSLSEKYQLTRKSDTNAGETKRDLLAASARVVGLDPNAALAFDPAQQTTVMTPDFTEALVAWKRTKGIENPTRALDRQFFDVASARSSATLLYHRADAAD